MPSPVRYPAGVSTAARDTTLFNFPGPDPTKCYTYFNDFNEYVAGDWTITTTEDGAGSATEALGDAAGGVLVVTTDNADNDTDFFQKVGESFLMAVGKKAWFKARVKLSAVTQSEMHVGLMVTDTDPYSSTAGDGVTDGIFFMKEDGTAAMALYCQKDATTGQLSTTGVHTMVDDTWVVVGWEYDGASTIKYFIDDVHKGTVDLTTSPTAYLPDTELTVSFGVKNGEGSATKVLSIDYIFAAIER